MSGRYEWRMLHRRIVELEAAWKLAESDGRAAEARAEKAEARVAELERDVATWSPARHYGEYEPDWEPIESGLRDRIPRKAAGTTYCLVHGAAYATEEWGASSPPVLLGVSCLKCGWRSGPVGRFTVTEVDEGANTVTISSEPITKTAPQTPVPAPEGTETVQKAPPPSPVGAPRSDQGSNSAGQVGNPGPVLGHPRGLESSSLDMPYPVDRRATTCEDVDLTKPQTLRAYATFGEASPENTATFPDVWIVTPPRAGLPSRDEVAAFLEARWPK